MYRSLILYGWANALSSVRTLRRQKIHRFGENWLRFVLKNPLCHPQTSSHQPLLRLAMKGLLLVTGAILFQFNTFSCGAFVLGGDIVTLATLGAR